MQHARQQEPAQLVIRRSYRVAPEKVWRAWTDPQALSQWFGPGERPSDTTAEMDLRVGGRYHIEFRAPNGQTHGVIGLYRVVEPYRRLVFTWAWTSTPERVSRVSVELQEHGDGTEMTFVHDRFVDAVARANHERGWQPFFVRLDELLQRIAQAT